MTYPISESLEDTSLGHEARKFLGHRKTTWSNSAKSHSAWDWAAIFLPCIAWLRTYNFKRNLIVRPLSAVQLAEGALNGRLVVPKLTVSLEKSALS